jgi:hypothetical protein
VAVKRTINCALPPPSIEPNGQVTDVVVVVHVDVIATPPTSVEIDLTVTDDGNVTLTTTWVAVAPPIPDWLLKLVIEIASFPGSIT